MNTFERLPGEYKNTNPSDEALDDANSMFALRVVKSRLLHLYQWTEMDSYND